LLDRWNGVLQTVADVLIQTGFATRFSKETRQVEACSADLTAELDWRKALAEEKLVGERSIFVT
jgi:hypothetical protein